MFGMGTGIASPLWPPGIINNVGLQSLPFFEGYFLPPVCQVWLPACGFPASRFFRKALTLHHQGVFNQDSFGYFSAFIFKAVFVQRLERYTVPVAGEQNV